MISRIIGIGIAASFLTMALTVATGVHDNIIALRYIVLVLAVGLSMIIVAISYLLKSHNKHRKFREMYQLTFAAGEFSRAANERLRRLAKEAREANEEILLFQSDGLRAFQNRPWYRGKSYESLGQELQKRFKGKQEFFYETYNKLKSVEDLAYISFEANSWKGYAGEPELPPVHKVV